MKLFLSVLPLLFISTLVFAGPGDAFDTKDVSLSISSLSDAEHVLEMRYSEISENFILTTREKIDKIRIEDTFGNLVFEIPIMSNKVSIDLGNLDRGTYTLNMWLEEYGQISSKLTKKI